MCRGDLAKMRIHEPTAKIHAVRKYAKAHVKARIQKEPIDRFRGVFRRVGGDDFVRGRLAFADARGAFLQGWRRPTRLAQRCRRELGDRLQQGLTPLPSGAPSSAQQAHAVKRSESGALRSAQRPNDSSRGAAASPRRGPRRQAARSTPLLVPPRPADAAGIADTLTTLAELRAGGGTRRAPTSAAMRRARHLDYWTLKGMYGTALARSLVARFLYRGEHCRCCGGLEHHFLDGHLVAMTMAELHAGHLSSLMLGVRAWRYISTLNSFRHLRTRFSTPATRLAQRHPIRASTDARDAVARSWASTGERFRRRIITSIRGRAPLSGSSSSAPTPTRSRARTLSRRQATMKVAWPAAPAGLATGFPVSRL